MRAQASGEARLKAPSAAYTSFLASHRISSASPSDRLQRARRKLQEVEWRTARLQRAIENGTADRRRAQHQIDRLDDAFLSAVALLEQAEAFAGDLVCSECGAQGAEIFEYWNYCSRCARPNHND